MFNGLIEKAGVAGFVTRSGADLKTITLSADVADGMPLKEVNGVASVLATGDTLDKLIGVLVRAHDGFALKAYPQKRTVCSAGYIQVPVATSVTPTRNAPVYFDATNKVFTTDKTKVQVRAVFASDGVRDGVAEIQVVDQVVVPTE